MSNTKNDLIKQKLSALTTKKTKASDKLWKPTPGKQVVRIVPYKFTPDFPFIELKFHYGINGKTYLSPDTFNKPDPIVEFSNRLKTNGDRNDWKTGKKLEPKMRTYAPVIVRGKENEGVKFWGFGKQVYQEILSIMNEPDYGDITDLKTGRDITVDFKSAAEAGKDFPETSIRVKPNTSPAVDPANAQLVKLLDDQIDILSIWTLPSYEELEKALSEWLDKGGPLGNDATTTPATASPSAEAAAASTEGADAMFDNLFGKKK